MADPIKPRLLVTGGSGFVGRHLLRYACEEYSVTATGRGDRPEGLDPEIQWIACDLTDPNLHSRLNEHWDGAIHLAAETIPSRFTDTAPLIDSLRMLLNLLDTIKVERFLFVSSCHVYSDGKNDKTETSEVRPEGRYGLSKLLCETAARSSRGAAIRIARPFNHIGSGMRPELAVPAIIRRAINAKAGQPLEMQGLDSIRDFLDVEDIARAYLAIMKIADPEPLTFNVCSGISVSISELTRAALVAIGKSNPVRFAGIKNSSDDTSRLVGDPTRLISATSWKRTITLDKSILRLIDAHQ